MQVEKVLAAANPVAETSADVRVPHTEAPITIALRIGDAWPSGGIYAGISRGEDGQPDGHLVLLLETPDAAISWPDAMEWAKCLGDGARLPTRFESALLYAHVREHLDTSQWHWTGTQSSAGDAWLQNFYFGYQTSNYKSFKARARAVRRFTA